MSAVQRPDEVKEGFVFGVEYIRKDRLRGGLG
jgi:hypothetical protein